MDSKSRSHCFPEGAPSGEADPSWRRKRSSQQNEASVRASTSTIETAKEREIAHLNSGNLVSELLELLSPELASRGSGHVGLSTTVGPGKKEREGGRGISLGSATTRGVGEG